jgi:hypothetical protein
MKKHATQTLSLGQLVNRLALADLHVAEATYQLNRARAICDDSETDLDNYIAERTRAHGAVAKSARNTLDTNPHPAITVTLDGMVAIDYTKLLDRPEEKP